MEEWDPKQSPLLVRQKGKPGQQAFHACWDGKRWIVVLQASDVSCKIVEVTQDEWEQVAS